MKTHLTKLLIVPALLALLATLNSQLSTASAQSTAFTYQGRLQDQGAPANGHYDLTFALFTAAQNGNQTGVTLTNLATVVTNGLFTMTLDFGAQFPGDNRWLAIGVRTNGNAGAFTVLTPRQPVTATPYAIQAINATTATVAASAGSVAAANISGTIPATQLSGTIPAAVLPAVLNTLSEPGIGNFFAGSGAGASVTSGNANTANGFGALTANTSGGGNTANGFEALYANTNGNRNTANGDQALAANTTGSDNTANGYGTLAANTTGNYNTANGDGALYANTNGSDNTANGVNALQANTTGNGNTADGATALQANTNGGFNTAIGDGALFNHTTGSHNIAIGSQAGGNLHTGDNNIYLGNLGADGENGLIRIGIPGVQTDTYLAGAVHGDGGGLTNLNAAQLNGAIPAKQLSGTIPTANLPNGLGGFANTASGSYAVVGGGGGNQIQSAADHATIGGGNGNQISGYESTIGGGFRNQINGQDDVVAGGDYNVINSGANQSFIGGGLNNTNSGSLATIPGGDLNVATNHSFAAGHRAKAVNSGAFVWADSQDADFASTANDQFSVRAQGGARFVTGSAGLTLNGAPVLTSSSFIPSSQLSGTIPAAVLPDVLNTLSEQGSGNFFAGNDAGAAARSGTHINSGNTATGDEALFSNLYGNGNTATGDGALHADMDGDGNTANGNGALYSNTSGSDNTAVGAGALGAITFSKYNTATGSGALSYIVTGIGNTANGYYALVDNTNGSMNIAIGYAAGGNLKSGDYNIYIGNNGGSTESGIIRIGDSDYQTATYLAGTVYANGVLLTSDRNAKEDFAPVSAQTVLAKVAALPITEWNYKTDAAGQRHLGPMAQDFHAAFELNGTDDKHISVIDEGGVALAAIQGLNEKLEQKQTEITELKARLDKLESLVLTKAGGVK